MVLVRSLEPSDREAWEPMWRGYLTFYKTSLPPEQFDLTWSRFHDPAFAPGISHREPGGLSTREALSVIQSLNANIIGADVVELNPTQDVSGVTEMVAAKVFKEIVAKMLEKLEIGNW